MLWQPPLAPRYHDLSDEQLADAIAVRKAQLGSDLVILGHHYQQDSVIQFADFTGDSFKLSQLAAQRVRESGAKYVVFLGVHFMAETADILTDPAVQVILPDLGAGCSMADMANEEQTSEAWDMIHEAIGNKPVRVIPICYMNCTAAIKSFCGEHGGAVCTSSNASAIIQWALAGGDTPLAPGESVKILFLPDQHLGRNTADQLGFDIDKDTAVWDPQALEPLDARTIEQATFLLWKGHCSVHKLFRPEHVDQVREAWPNVTVIAHPECSVEVCQKADRTGSTEAIIQAIAQAPPKSQWAIGTEVHLVNRLAHEAKARQVQVRMLSDCQCLCTTMYRIDMPHVLWVLDELAAGRVANPIRVPSDIQQGASLALDRMLRITAELSPAGAR